MKPRTRFFLNFCLEISIILATAISVYPQRVRKLKSVEIESISLILDSAFIRLPGYPFPVALKVISDKNGVLYTRGLGGGDLRWTNFKIQVKGGSFVNGKIIVSSKLFPGDYIEIIATSKYHPTLRISKVIRLNYIENMDIFPIGNFQKIPGEMFSFGIQMKYDNGCRETITSWNKNYKLMNSLKFEFFSIGGSVKNNSFAIDQDFENIPDHKVCLWGTTPRIPVASDSIGFVLDYRGNFQYHDQALSGFSGRNGSSGSSGSNGSESENGKNGQDGECGEHGDNGRNGDFLEVFCDAYFDSIVQAELLYIEVRNTESLTLKKYLVNPDGGSIRITSAGGSGGSGGCGGSGGSGGKGGDGKKYTKEVRDTSGVKYITCQENGGNGGQGGRGGNGGCGGNGGHGGDIDIFYTENAKPYLWCIKVECPGGWGGSGGSGGSGGIGGSSGLPGGSNGSAGSSGTSGSLGYRGLEGEVSWLLIDE